MKKFLIVCILIGTFLSSLGCILTRYYNPDPFYSSTGDWDSIRFPLIKPYEAIRIAGGNGWGINLPVILGEPDLHGSVQNFKKLSITDGVILVYTSNKPNARQEMLEQIKIYNWYVIIPSKNIQRGFESEDDFQSYIQELGIYEVTWENPDSIYRQFEQIGCLDWIPECR